MWCQAPDIAGHGQCQPRHRRAALAQFSRMARAHTLQGSRTRRRALREVVGIWWAQPPASPYATARVAPTAPRPPRRSLRREWNQARTAHYARALCARVMRPRVGADRPPAPLL